ncbi:catalase family protein [Nitrospirillum bahiense]|uniref:Catalase n=1 Tax=Nitrospirillum amazonense TaxID=28077 RepID=A0A560FHA8_9PROT|nr:catalase [Nitrospirillum amazonense]TWB21001.1 catalase [Nitrospirillum amazonense]
MTDTERWREVFDGGSIEAEKESFQRFAEVFQSIQEATRRKFGWSHPQRTLHAKQTAGIEDARLLIDDDAPARFCQGYVQAGKEFGATVRFSNASAAHLPDASPDLRGVALRVAIPGGGFHDLLMTSFPVSHARNARQFVEFAMIASSGDRATLPERLVEHFGAAETRRMLENIQQGARKSPGLARERFWSRGAYLWGEAGPVRFNLRPWSDDDAKPAEVEPDDLNADFSARLAQGPVNFKLALQSFVDEERTPIEDGAVEWREAVTPSIDIATLVIPGRPSIDAEAAARVDGLAFNPWNAPEGFRPLGNLNRARGAVYSASAALWRK